MKKNVIIICILLLIALITFWGFRKNTKKRENENNTVYTEETSDEYEGSVDYLELPNESDLAN